MRKVTHTWDPPSIVRIQKRMSASAVFICLHLLPIRNKKVEGVQKAENLSREILLIFMVT